MSNVFHEATTNPPVNPRELLTWPSVAIINRAKQSLGVDLELLAAALQDFVAVHYGPLHNCFCTVTVKDKPDTGDWPMLFVDNDKVADAVAFHDAVNGTAPEMVVDVTKALASDGTVSLAAGHELAEALSNPFVSLACFLDNGAAIMHETVDPVQDTAFEVRGLKMPNFITPAWFNGSWKKGEQPFDYCGAIDEPLTITEGGYAIIYNPATRRWHPFIRNAKTLNKVKDKIDGRSRLRQRGCTCFNYWLNPAGRLRD